MAKPKKEDRNKKKDKARIWYISIIVILVIIILFLLMQTYRQYQTFRVHRSYFGQQQPTIQPWMTVHGIKRHFNITEDELKTALNMSSTLKVDDLTLIAISAQNHLNCTSVVDSLNRLR